MKTIRKCQKSKETVACIEGVFSRPVMMILDSAHSQAEKRFWAIGKTGSRRVFVVFTLRRKGEKIFLRPISARYMHKKEIERFEKENPEIQD